MRLLADNRKAYKLMNWKPRYASFKNFKKAIKITIEWTKKIKAKIIFNLKSMLFKWIVKIKIIQKLLSIILNH